MAVVVAAVLAATACGGGNEDGDAGSDQPGSDRPGSEQPGSEQPGSGETGSSDVPLKDTLVLTRADGTTVSLTDATVDCGESDTQPPEPAILIETPREDASGGGPEAWLYVELIRADVEGGTTITLPQSYDASDPQIGRLFVVDFETGNRVSSSAADSSGRIAVESATCDPTPAIAMTVDATLGSELRDMPSADIAGTLVLTGD
jgi:hypothetical protein